MVRFPVLVGEMAKKEIKRKQMSELLGISEKALKNKLDGKTAFTWPEAYKIQNTFFPYIEIKRLLGAEDPEEQEVG